MVHFLIQWLTFHADITNQCWTDTPLIPYTQFVEKVSETPWNPSYSYKVNPFIPYAQFDYIIGRLLKSEQDGGKSNTCTQNPTTTNNSQTGTDTAHSLLFEITQSLV